MDDMGTPGPNHPARRGLKGPADNVIELPNMGTRRFRKAKNKLSDHLFGKEQVTYEKPFNNDEVGPQDPHSKLAKHIASTIANSGFEGLHEELSRLGHFNTGGTEAKIISMGKFKENRDNKKITEGQNE